MIRKFDCMHLTKFIWLDFMRGAAALLVFAGHLRALTFREYAGETHNIAEKLFYFLTGFGHQCVVIFFVLSGFFITKSIHGSVKNQKWSFKNYGVDRLTRLWIVLLPALIMTFAADSMGLSFFPDAAAYSGQIEHMPGTDPRGQSSVVVFLGNLFFQQGIFCPTYGSNTPLWSLSFEFWYYVVFPCLYLAFLPKKTMNVRIALTAVAFICLIYAGETIAKYFAVWLSGAFCYFAFFEWNNRNPKTISIAWTSVAALAFIAVLTIIRANAVPLLFNDFTLGFVTSILVFTVAGRSTKFALMERLAIFLSDISYTLYLIHLPITILITAGLVRHRLTWGLGSILIYSMLLILILGISYLFWYLFEKRTPDLKRYIKARLSQ
jgi:peptidoglycan/LPS O-acetylase OafA/YrhL